MPRLVVIAPSPVDDKEIEYTGSSPSSELISTLLNGGYFEMHTVRYKNKVRNGYVDEEGRRKGLPYNDRATEYDYYNRDLCGNMIIDMKE